MTESYFVTARPIAHRGLHRLEPGVVENMPRAFAAAIAGNYAIECDIQLTADGEAIVFHDDVLDRLTVGTGPVRARTAEEIKALAFRATDDKPATLAELLAQVAGAVPLVVEVKSLFDGDMRLVARAAALVSDYAGPLALMSFDPAPIAWLKANRPDLVRGIVAESNYENDHWRARIGPEMRRALPALTHFPETDPHFISWKVADLPNAATVLFRSVLRRPVISWTIRNAADRAIGEAHSDQITFEDFRA